MTHSTYKSSGQGPLYPCHVCLLLLVVDCGVIEPDCGQVVPLVVPLVACGLVVALVVPSCFEVCMA